MGFLGIANRYAGLDAKSEPLARIDEAVPWEALRPRLERGHQPARRYQVTDDLPELHVGRINFFEAPLMAACLRYHLVSPRAGGGGGPPHLVFFRRPCG